MSGRYTDRSKREEGRGQKASGPTRAKSVGDAARRSGGPPVIPRVAGKLCGLDACQNQASVEVPFFCRFSSRLEGSIRLPMCSDCHELAAFGYTARSTQEYEAKAGLEHAECPNCGEDVTGTEKFHKCKGE